MSFPAASFRADPNRTFAIVVGIERYDISESWNLDGPAADAVRFVNWLRSRNVPAAQTWLHLSALNQAESLKALTDPAVMISPATRESIRRRVIDLLTVPGDLLYFFWGGHGGNISPRDRRLYYADAGPEDRQNLQINSLLDFLQSEKMKIKHQIAFIDTCANIVNDPDRLALDLFPRVRTTADVVQSFFFAAAPGQKAANNAVRRGGAFSEQVQAALDKATGEFPPNPTLIIKAVKNHLDESSQTGVCYESQDWDGNIRTSPGSTEGPYLRFAARKLHLPLRQLEHLCKAFGKCPQMQEQQSRDKVVKALERALQRQIYRPEEVLNDTPADLLRQFTAAWSLDRCASFQKAFESFEPFSLESEEVSDLLVRLRRLDEARNLVESLRGVLEIQPLLVATMPGSTCTEDSALEDVLGETLTPASDELPLFFELLTRILLQTATDDPGRPALQEFLNRYCTQQTSNRIRATLEREAAKLPHSLLVQAVPGKPDQLLALWVRDDGRIMDKWEFDCPADEIAVAQKISDIFAIIWKKGDFPFSIDVFLGPQTLHWTPDSWTRVDDFGIPERFSARYPVCVHWVKRWSEPGTSGEWNRIIEKIRERFKAGCPPCCSFLQSSESRESIITEELIAGRLGPFIAFLFAVTIEPGKAPPRELAAAIRSGAPFVCWLREPPADWEEYRKEVQSLLPQPPQPKDFEQIPYQVFKARKAASDDPPPEHPEILGGKLTLLWDDSRRSPFEHKYRPPS